MRSYLNEMQQLRSGKPKLTAAGTATPLYLQKMALSLPISGSRSVCTVRLRTKSLGDCFISQFWTLSIDLSLISNTQWMFVPHRKHITSPLRAQQANATSMPVMTLYNCNKKKNSMALSPQANYTDWVTATCRRNLVPTFVDRGVSRGQHFSILSIVLSFVWNLQFRRLYSVSGTASVV
jgi:hypothetical protein